MCLSSAAILLCKLHFIQYYSSISKVEKTGDSVRTRVLYYNVQNLEQSNFDKIVVLQEWFF
jgi:hypothetical protein